MSKKSGPGRPEPEAAADAADAAAAEAAAADAAAAATPVPEQSLEYWRDQHLRTLAELQNQRRRSAQEVEERTIQRLEGLLTDLLRVDDYFEAALAHVPASLGSAEGAAPFLAGVTAIRQALESVLMAHGAQFLAPGPQSAFDPAEHEAVEVRHDPTATAVRLELLARGCRLGRRILRPARVRLVQPAQAPPASADPGGPASPAA